MTPVGIESGWAAWQCQGQPLSQRLIRVVTEYIIALSENINIIMVDKDVKHYLEFWTAKQSI
jgi:hypothetical protein